jgi:hypothetical protein
VSDADHWKLAFDRIDPAGAEREDGQITRPKTGAVEAFRKSVATEEKNCNEYDFAKAALKSLGQ